MSDVYKAREADLRQCDEIFKPVANQVGLLAFIGGKPAGADIVSLASAYAKLHPKLVRSYTLEGLLDAPPSPPRGEGKGEVAPKSALHIPHSELTRAFLAEITAAEERQFPSVGHGTDYRYKAKALAGSVLVHQNEVIHAAFFHLEDTEQLDHMASIRRRRHYRE